MVTYADGPSAAVEVEVAAPPDVVWPIVCDINAPAAFSAEFQGAEWIDEGHGLGARFRGRNRHEAVGEWSVTCTVTALEDHQVFEWIVEDVANPTARWRFELAPTADGSRLRFSAEMGPGPSGLTPVIERHPDLEDEIVGRRLAEWTANMRATVEGYRELAESRHDPDS